MSPVRQMVTDAWLLPSSSLIRSDEGEAAASLPNLSHLPATWLPAV